MKLFFHDKNELANELTSKTVLHDRGFFDIYLKKKIYSQVCFIYTFLLPFSSLFTFQSSKFTISQMKLTVMPEG